MTKLQETIKNLTQTIIDGNILLDKLERQQATEKAKIPTFPYISKMMVVKEKRGRGKTAKLVDLLMNNSESLLLVFSEREREGIIQNIHPKDDSGCWNRIYTWDYYLGHPYLHGRPLLIDNADLFLREHFRSKDIGISINE